VAYAAGGYVAEENAEVARGPPPAAALLPCDASLRPTAASPPRPARVKDGDGFSA